MRNKFNSIESLLLWHSKLERFTITTCSLP